MEDGQHIFIKKNYVPTLALFMMAHFSACFSLLSISDPRGIALFEENLSNSGQYKKAINPWTLDQASVGSVYS